MVANCDTKLFLGCDDSETIKWLLEMLGKKTTTVENTSYQEKGKGSTSYNKDSIDLLTIDQITMMQDDECLVRIRGVRPYFGKKFELTNHKNYKYAASVKGKFEIPLSKDVSERPSGPLWKRKIGGKVAEMAATAETEKKELSPDEKKKEQQKKHREKEKQRNINNRRKANEASETAKNFDKTAKKQPSKEEDKEIMNALGLNENSTPEEIKEAMETVIDLTPPNEALFTYAMTN